MNAAKVTWRRQDLGFSYLTTKVAGYICIVVARTEHSNYVGLSFCSPKDRYSLDKAIEIACERIDESSFTHIAYSPNNTALDYVVCAVLLGKPWVPQRVRAAIRKRLQIFAAALLWK